jgi:hypothetical protein
MPTTEQPERDIALRAWDWRAELRQQGRSVGWLARQTNRAESTVYKIAGRQMVPSIAWLEDVARVLGVEVPA